MATLCEMGHTTPVYLNHQIVLYGNKFFSAGLKQILAIILLFIVHPTNCQYYKLTEL